jgi:hypothetical protein
MSRMLNNTPALFPSAPVVGISSVGAIIDSSTNQQQSLASVTLHLPYIESIYKRILVNQAQVRPCRETTDIGWLGSPAGLAASPCKGACSCPLL